MQSAQVIVKKLPSSPVRFGCRRGVVVSPIVASEGVIAARITIDLCVWLVGECGFDFSLRSLGNELVLLGQMHQQRRSESVDLAQIFLSVTAVIGYRGVDALARGG